MVMLRDPVLALDFDLAATARLLEAERRAMSGEDTRRDDSAPAGTKDIHW
jgi:hypothetical protein